MNELKVVVQSAIDYNTIQEKYEETLKLLGRVRYLMDWVDKEPSFRNTKDYFLETLEIYAGLVTSKDVFLRELTKFKDLDKPNDEEKMEMSKLEMGLQEIDNDLPHLRVVIYYSAGESFLRENVSIYPIKTG